MKHLKKFESIFDDNIKIDNSSDIVSVNKKTGDFSKGGYIDNIKYDELVNTLGPSQYDPEEDDDADYEPKTTCSWIIEFADGNIVEIYDYKSGMPYHENMFWHIGYDTAKNISKTKTEEETLIQTVLDNVQHVFPNADVFSNEDYMRRMMNFNA